MHAATGAGVDARALPASQVVGGEWGHVASMQDLACSELGDRLTKTWRWAAISVDGAPHAWPRTGATRASLNLGDL
jgi:hypothetical protein